ncbi:MAG: efflux RND transporter permease subunit [Alphaproteobacteria bacterium]|nr:efflux RND transporter permease subunit [Alphaproteobacteria bacterium]
MRWLVESALHFRVLVMALALVLVGVGLQATIHAPQDVFPEFAPPLVEIQTEAPGLSTLEVESLVTTPLEQELRGLPWVTDVRSKSVLGLSSVVLHFAHGTDALLARQLVAERMQLAARRLPAVALPPVMLPPLSSTSRLMKIGMTSDTLSGFDLTDLALDTVRPRLMAIPGVANVAVWGARTRELQVQVDPGRLAALGVPLATVVDATRRSTSLVTGGFVDTPNQRLAVQHDPAVASVADLARQPVVTGAGPALTLGDAGTVVEGAPPLIGDAVIGTGDGLLLIVEKQPWGNTLQVTRAVDAALDELAPALRDVDVDPTIFRPATFIERAIDNLVHAMTVGIVLVLLVLFVFESDWRAAVISATAIPVSLLAAVLVLTWMGQTFNTMVLAGLIIAVGEVVDDAIIDVENVSRRLRGPRDGRPVMQVILGASLEVRSAVVYASLIVVLVFLPVLGLGGVSGAFFRPLAIAYVAAISASLLVALTLTPAMCSWLLPGRTGVDREPLLPRVLRRGYRAVLPRWMMRPGVAVAVLVVTSLAGAGLATRLGQSFLPSFKETDFLMHWVEKPGTSLDAMKRITVRAAEELLTVPGVRNFGAHIGRAEAADEVVGPNFTELWISIDEDVDHDATVARIQEVVDGYPGLTRDVLTYLRERIKEVVSGGGATLVVRVMGSDLEALQEGARVVEAELGQLDGVVHPRVDVQAMVPQLHVRVRPEAQRIYGVTAADVREATTTLLRGTVAGAIQRGQRDVPVVVRGRDALVTSPAALRDLLIDTPSGGVVPVSTVAEVWIEAAPNVVKHEGGFRHVDVLADVGNGDVVAVGRDVEAHVAGMELPRGVHVEVAGEHVAQRSAARELAVYSGVSLVAIFLLLHADLRSVRLAALVYASLPFALVGGVVAVLASGGVLSLGGVVGFVTVFGIAARNAILLVSHYRHLRLEGVPHGVDLVVTGAVERLAPILMTAACAGLALLPIAWAGPVAGYEVEHPMAVVILGGLLSSTVLNLVLLPSLYLAWGDVDVDASA